MPVFLPFDVISGGVPWFVGLIQAQIIEKPLKIKNPYSLSQVRLKNFYYSSKFSNLTCSALYWWVVYYTLVQNLPYPENTSPCGFLLGLWQLILYVILDSFLFNIYSLL
jgi:hypothetical protein